MLVNSALSAGTWPCREVGWFLGDFDDTGGAHEDLWAVQTAAGEINVGVPVPDPTDWTSYTPSLTTNGGGAITLGQIRVEFGGSIPDSISEYYKGGANVPNTPANSTIPTSGQIKFSNFYGGSKASNDNTIDAVIRSS